MPLGGENVRQKFNGNTCWYIFNARHQQRVFLPRNINTVLRANEARRQRQSGQESSRSSSEMQLEGQRRRRLGIDDALGRLRPAVRADGSEEPILKIEVKSLKRKRLFRPKTTPNALNGVSGSREWRQQKAIRCRCELTIYENVDGRPEPARSRFGYRDDANQLFRSNEPCTVTYEADDTATIEMDDPFYIKASKLYVPTKRGPNKAFGLAESYTAQLALQAMDPASLWPPLLNDGSPSEKEWGDPFDTNLITIISGLPYTASSTQPEVLLKMDESFERADLSLEMDCGWSRPGALLRVTGPRPRTAARLPTPNSERERDSDSPAESVLTCFFFMSPVENDKLHNYFGAPNMRGQHAFTVPGYTCPFCDGREFPNCKFLHFHFITAHDLFQFKVKQRKPTSGLRSGNADYDNYVEVWVDLSRDFVINRASDNLPDHRTFQWIKPKKDFDLVKILAKNDWSWLNERKGVAPIVLRRGTSPDNLSPQGPKKIDLKNVPEIPTKKRKRYIVPEPRNGIKGLVFIRSKSKRFIHPGEELSESDDEVDEDWLKMKHEETIDDFEDVAKNEQTFMKLWDRHMFNERPSGDLHIPHAAIRFSRANADYLRHSNLLVEFWKHLINYVQYDIIDAECVRVCMDIVKGNEWSSVGKSKWGIGLVGPLALDNTPPSSPESSNQPLPSKLNASEDLDVDMNEESDQSELQVKQEDALSALRKEYSSTNGICKCRKGWDRPDMVRCNGKMCPKRWFHRSCFDVGRWQEDWLCPLCSAETSGEAS